MMMMMMILQHQHNDHDREWQAQEESGGNCKYLRSRGSAHPYLALSHQPPASFYHDDDDYVLYLSCEYIYLYIWLYRTNHQSAVILMMIGIIYYVYYIDILIFIWLYHTKHQSALILMMMTGIMYYVCYIDILIFIYIIGAITPSTSQHDDDNQYIMRLRTNSVCLSPNKVIRALFNTNTPPKTPI